MNIKETPKHIHIKQAKRDMLKLKKQLLECCEIVLYNNISKNAHYALEYVIYKDIITILFFFFF